MSIWEEGILRGKLSTKLPSIIATETLDWSLGDVTLDLEGGGAVGRVRGERVSVRVLGVRWDGEGCGCECEYSLMNQG